MKIKICFFQLEPGWFLLSLRHYVNVWDLVTDTVARDANGKRRCKEESQVGRRKLDPGLIERHLVSKV